MKWFHRFSQRHPDAGVPRLATVLAIGQGIVALFFALTSSGNPLRGVDFIYRLSFVPSLFLGGQVWRLVTFLFVPENLTNLLWSLLSAYVLLWMGRQLEASWSRFLFNVYYFLGIVISVGFSLITGVPATPFYVNMSLFFALATMYPDNVLMLLFIIPVKFKYVALVEAALFILLPLLSLPLTLWNLYPLLAIGNYLVFFGNQLRHLLKRGVQTGRTRGQTARRATQFKAAVRQTKQQRGYVHKCALCGATDADSPDMEFRYCSLCVGYQCYCSKHIFDHVHTTMK